MSSNVENECHFCGDTFLRDKEGDYKEEVAEIISRDPARELHVLVHPDCCPNGYEAIQMDEDQDWIPA